MSEPKVNYAIDFALEQAKFEAEQAQKKTKETDANRLQNMMQLMYDDTEGKRFMLTLISKMAFMKIETVREEKKIYTESELSINIADGNGKIHLSHVEMIIELLSAIIARSAKVGGIFGLDKHGEKMSENDLIEWVKAKFETETRYQLFEDKGIFVR